VVENREWTTVYVVDKRINAVPWRAHITGLTAAVEMVDDAVIILRIVLHICGWKSGQAASPRISLHDNSPLNKNRKK